MGTVSKCVIKDCNNELPAAQRNTSNFVCVPCQEHFQQLNDDTSTEDSTELLMSKRILKLSEAEVLALCGLIGLHRSEGGVYKSLYNKLILGTGR